MKSHRQTLKQESCFLGVLLNGSDMSANQSINQSINTFITRHGTEAVQMVQTDCMGWLDQQGSLAVEKRSPDNKVWQVWNWSAANLLCQLFGHIMPCTIFLINNITEDAWLCVFDDTIGWYSEEVVHQEITTDTCDTAQEIRLWLGKVIATKAVLLQSLKALLALLSRQYWR